MVIDIAIPNMRNIRKEYEKLEKYQGLKKELEKMWKLKIKVGPVRIETLGIVKTPEKWLQQIPGTTSEISI